MQTTERFEKVAVDRLIPYARNARTHSKEQITQLRASLREFGFVNPIICDKDYNIIAGHGRILAAKAEGMAEVPCVFVEHLTEAQKRAYILADNRLALSAGWDEELLALEFGELQDLGFDLQLTGFDAAEIEKMFGKQDAVEDDDFVFAAELERPAVTRPGDLWLLGRHRLICGDSTLPETYSVLMDGKKANLVVTDLPYNVNYEGTAGKIQNDNLPREQFYKLILDAFIQMEIAMAGDASIYVFHADTEGLNFRRAYDEAGFKLSGTCIWAKNALVLGRSPYQWQHEPVLFGWKKKGKHQWYSDRKQSTIWNFDRPAKNTDHPTMKPIPLLAYPITNSSMENCIVLDPFSGSFSTGIACEQTNRICFAVEIDPKYVDVSVARYINQVGGADDVFVVRDGKTLPYSEVRHETV
ncbi:MAG: site-specific DNA-methyltransferase [Oscillospiraceae bacterium]|nr:site-specific DNA-methyltransferase [Oscillospiraceae bacterium]